MIWSAELAELREGEYFTFLKSIFDALENKQLKFNFLLLGIEACPNREEYEFVNRDPVWITGKALTEMVCDEDFLWIWGAFLAFPQDVTEEEAVAGTCRLYIPESSDMDSWNIRNRFSETKAEFMIFAEDSTYVELLSREKNLIDIFCTHKPLAKVTMIEDTLEES